MRKKRVEESLFLRSEVMVTKLQAEAKGIERMRRKVMVEVAVVVTVLRSLKVVVEVVGNLKAAVMAVVVASWREVKEGG